MSKHRTQTSYQDIGRTPGRRTPPAPRPPASPPERHGDRRSGDDGDDDAARKFLTGPAVCSRYAVSDMTIWRWLADPELHFPQPAMRVLGRRYWLESDLRKWERGRGDATVSRHVVATPA